MIATWCPQCGPRVDIDEDGCCKSCGADATGEGADRAAALEAAVAQLPQHVVDPAGTGDRPATPVEVVEIAAHDLMALQSQVEAWRESAGEAQRLAKEAIDRGSRALEALRDLEASRVYRTELAIKILEGRE